MRKSATHRAVEYLHGRTLSATEAANFSLSGHGDGGASDPLSDRLIDGASFILDQPAGVPAVWGDGESVLWAEGEALMITGPSGVGKTTLAGAVLLGLLGIEPSVLGLPVKQHDRVLYLAMDRPRQIARALGRVVTEQNRNLLHDGLSVWPGPPPEDLAQNPDTLARLASKANAEVVVVDSLKDAAIGLSEDDTGAGWNRARQTVIADGIEMLELHHTRKDSGTSIDSIYGSTWITSGAGSVIHLGGSPGASSVKLTHLKQPAEPVGPLTLHHDQSAGTMTREPDAADLLAAVLDSVLESGDIGVTPYDIAQSKDRAPVNRAKRLLDKLCDSGDVRCVPGRPGGTPTRYFAQHPE